MKIKVVITTNQGAERLTISFDTLLDLLRESFRRYNTVSGALRYFEEEIKSYISTL